MDCIDSSDYRRLRRIRM